MTMSSREKTIAQSILPIVAAGFDGDPFINDYHAMTGIRYSIVSRCAEDIDADNPHPYRLESDNFDIGRRVMTLEQAYELVAQDVAANIVRAEENLAMIHQAYKIS